MLSGDAVTELSSFARELALAARSQTLQGLPRELAVEDKSKGGLFDPVTDADRLAEQTMRELIAQRYADHGIRGEEFPDQAARGPFTWSLDPIDGTRSYICGLPTWTTLIALLEEEEPAIGVIDAPRLDETYLGAGGESIVIKGGEQSRLSTSGCRELAEARFSTTDPFLFGPEAGVLQPILRAVRVTRFGLDAYAYARLAAGDIDLVIECGLKPHDYNALVPVIRGAGGQIGDWRGGSDFAPGNVVAASSRELYDAAVALLATE
ncbi:MAG TPA: inositol monophosphatase family protein [Sphingomicrobium sp.]